MSKLNSADLYQVFINHTNQHQLEANTVAKVLNNTFNAENKLRVADLGCGVGRLLSLILPKLKPEVAIDYFDPNRDMVKEYAGAFSEQSKIALHNYEEWTISEFENKNKNSYDLIFSCHSFYQDSLQCVLSLIKHLKSRGTLIIIISKGQSPHQKLFSINQKRISSANVRKFLNSNQIPFESQSVNFEVDVSCIVRYLETGDKIGRNFLRLFLHNELTDTNLSLVRSIIENHSKKKENKIFLSGVSDIYVIPKQS